jgi:hypothetical protein
LAHLKSAALGDSVALTSSLQMFGAKSSIFKLLFHCILPAYELKWIGRALVLSLSTGLLLAYQWNDLNKGAARLGLASLPQSKPFQK